jgi:hypothetical protein
MATLDDYINPKFERYREGWTLTRLTHDRYYKFDDARSFRNGQPQPGYNAQNPSTSPEVIRMDQEDIKMKPLIVTRF